MWCWQAASRVVVMWLTGVVNRESDASPACPTAACAGRVTASRIDGSATQSRTLHLYTAVTLHHSHTYNEGRNRIAKLQFSKRNATRPERNQRYDILFSLYLL